ncbi:hypothetical protein K1719_023629 [Acacia pycnantha]|nr:hypothetical protein K1719_023629 [Acacia pycnantha]
MEVRSGVGATVLNPTPAAPSIEDSSLPAPQMRRSFWFTRRTGCASSFLAWINERSTLHHSSVSSGICTSCLAKCARYNGGVRTSISLGSCIVATGNMRLDQQELVAWEVTVIEGRSDQYGRMPLAYTASKAVHSRDNWFWRC